MSKGIEFYKNELTRIMTNAGLEGGLIHSSFENGMIKKDLNSCYVDDRVGIKRGYKRMFKKDLAVLLDSYFAEFTEAKKPMYTYK